MFPNRIMQNYSKAAFIWQKENKLCLINNYCTQIAWLCLFLAPWTTVGESRVSGSKFIGIKSVRRGLPWWRSG